MGTAGRETCKEAIIIQMTDFFNEGISSQGLEGFKKYLGGGINRYRLGVKMTPGFYVGSLG